MTPPITTSISWGLYLVLAGVNALAFLFVRYCLGKWICPLKFYRLVADINTLPQWKQEVRRWRRWRTFLASRRSMPTKKTIDPTSVANCFDRMPMMMSSHENKTEKKHSIESLNVHCRSIKYNFSQPPAVAVHVRIVHCALTKTTGIQAHSGHPSVSTSAHLAHQS